MARHLDRSLIRPIEDHVDIELGDVLDLPRILSIIQSYKITHIIHTAALIGALSHKNPPQSIRINVIGTLNILEAARFMKVQRVVYTTLPEPGRTSVFIPNSPLESLSKII
jgi:FlaA1/EpsC-like NDP-sugar epimerase